MPMVTHSHGVQVKRFNNLPLLFILLNHFCLWVAKQDIKCIQIIFPCLIVVFMLTFHAYIDRQETNIFQVAILFSEKTITSNKTPQFFWLFKPNSIEDQEIHLKPYQYTS